MTSIKHVIIAAAGVGSRLGKGVPKVLVEVAGRKIIEYQLKLLEDIDHVRIIVGYLEDEVIKVAKSIRPDIEFVRNPWFRETTTLQSFYLGVKDLNEPFVIMDGDIIFDQKDFHNFMDYCQDGRDTIGVSMRIAENPVYVDIERNGDSLTARGFQTNPATGYEWANIACLNPGILAYEKTYVYQRLAEHLPLRAFTLDKLEVDTINDLEIAESILAQRDYVSFK